MKKIYILMLVLALALVFGKFIKPDLSSALIIVVNQEKYPELNQRLQIKQCLSGESGSFEEPFEVTLYTDNESIKDYRILKERIEKWGGICKLIKKETKEIFDFRSLGALSFYIWSDDMESLYQAFLSENKSFFSTGLSDKTYDALVTQNDFEGALLYLTENINIIIH